MLLVKLLYWLSQCTWCSKTCWNKDAWMYVKEYVEKMSTHSPSPCSHSPQTSYSNTERVRRLEQFPQKWGLDRTFIVSKSLETGFYFQPWYLMSCPISSCMTGSALTYLPASPIRAIPAVHIVIVIYLYSAHITRSGISTDFGHFGLKGMFAMLVWNTVERFSSILAWKRGKMFRGRYETGWWKSHILVGKG